MSFVVFIVDLTYSIHKHGAFIVDFELVFRFGEYVLHGVFLLFSVIGPAK